MLYNQPFHFITDISISDAFFNGRDSYMEFPPVPVQRETRVSMQMRAHADNGLLFYTCRHQHATARDFLAVTLAGGAVELRVDLGDGVRVLRSQTKIMCTEFKYYDVTGFCNVHVGMSLFTNGA